MTPTQAFRSGAHWLMTGHKTKAIHSLEYAAEKGHPLAQWKLGRMYAEGDGVAQNDLKAFKYFESIADHHADDNPNTRAGALRRQRLRGARPLLSRRHSEHRTSSAIPTRARQMFAYAASYFRDPDAQYYLARLYLDGIGAPHDPRTAARWFVLSAQKGQCQAQAMLGAMLFAGDHVPHQAARGLMWLTLAKDNAKDSSVADQAWINRLYDNAMREASEDDRALAGVYLKPLAGIAPRVTAPPRSARHHAFRPSWVHGAGRMPLPVSDRQLRMLRPAQQPSIVRMKTLPNCQTSTIMLASCGWNRRSPKLPRPAAASAPNPAER